MKFGVRKSVKATYDYAIDGCVTGISYKSSLDGIPLGVRLPAGALLERVRVHKRTQFVGAGGTASVYLVSSTGDYKRCIVTGGTYYSTAWQSLLTARYQTPVVLTYTQHLKVYFRTAVCTAGKYDFYVDYFI